MENLVQNQPLAKDSLTRSYRKILLLPQDIKSNMPQFVLRYIWERQDAKLCQHTKTRL